ncbi:MAG TPA: selenide, water dikinase SelD [Candidatus Limnocylindria bacterium]|nr:selenide, water dikinase SelD [Candidatus Limnocylindria bacterium]
MADIRLTSFATGGGCARKLAAEDLTQVLKRLGPQSHAWVDPGVGPFEDAAIVRMPGGRALAYTVDFITPIVDDPETFGAIAAANALSDVYAMGGEPQVALAVCGFPRERIGLEVLEAIFRGGRDKAAEAGCAVAGGHTIQDAELKYGLCVIGEVDPGHVLAHPRLCVGDRLVLTKPLGVGVYAQAVKRGALARAELDELVRVTTTLNKTAKDAALAARAHAATDVTGFGLLGHLRHLLLGAGLAARVSAASVPLMSQARALVAGGLVPGGSRCNLDYVAPQTRFAPAVSEDDRLLLADAQTSGGLLIAVSPSRVEQLCGELARAGTLAQAVVGEVVSGPAGAIEVRP